MPGKTTFVGSDNEQYDLKVDPTGDSTQVRGWRKSVGPEWVTYADCPSKEAAEAAFRLITMGVEGRRD